MNAHSSIVALEVRAPRRKPEPILKSLSKKRQYQFQELGLKRQAIINATPPYGGPDEAVDDHTAALDEIESEILAAALGKASDILLKLSIWRGLVNDPMSIRPEHLRLWKQLECDIAGILQRSKLG